MELVSWDAAWRELARGGFELPAEAQWEYAARAETATIWHFGDDLRLAPRYANVADRSYARAFVDPNPYEDFDDGYAVTAPVGSLQPSPFGLYDVCGNVREKCRNGIRLAGGERTAVGLSRRRLS